LEVDGYLKKYSHKESISKGNFLFLQVSENSWQNKKMFSRTEKVKSIKYEG